MPTLKQLLDDWFESTLPTAPKLPAFVPPIETADAAEVDAGNIQRYNTAPPSALSDDIWKFVRDWLVINQPKADEAAAGRFDENGVLHLTMQESRETKIVLISLNSSLGWTPLAEVPVHNGRVQYDSAISGMDLRNLAVAERSVRVEKVA